MNKICIIIPYFGKWPSYFKLFLNSCGFNPQLVILFFTDLPVPSNCPPNVRFHFFTFDQVRAQLDGIMGFKTKISTPYKLCDVRPCYGRLFEKYISDFDFWGWGDIDLVFGKVGNFIRPDLLRTYDVISCRKRWLSGSFCLVKNTHYLNSLFKVSKDLKLILTTEKYMGFDEVSRCWDSVWAKPFEEVNFPYDNFTRMVLEENKNGRLSCYFENYIKESIPKGDALLWKEGRLSDRDGNEYLLYHFITEKSNPYFQYPDWNMIPEKYYVDQFGFYTEHEFAKRQWEKNKRYVMSLPLLIRNLTTRIRKKLASYVRKSTEG